LKLQNVKNILICPLEWGLGHAGRMIPVASELIAEGHNVFIGSGKELADLFRNEVEGLKYIYFPGFTIKYSRWLPQYLKIAFSAPSFIYQIRKEHRLLKKIIKENDIDIVISDSRPGLWNKSIRTVFVTHMLRVPYPEALRFQDNRGISLIRKLISRFDYCFVPDLPGELNLSGKLSHGIGCPENVRFIGILSRFGTENMETVNSTGKYHCTVILSGPEPQKSMLKNRLARILEKSGKPCIILEGKPGEKSLIVTRGNLSFINHLPAGEMKNIILGSEHIIARSGYTTLMELVSLRRSALIIPTPGQSEQEYLAGLMAERGWFVSANQDSLKDDLVLPGNNAVWPEEITGESSRLLRSAVKELLE
jgi:UDP:flavonoid glycosyltransferase YjiC (YdhE family)